MSTRRKFKFSGTVVSGFACVTGLGGLLMWVRMVSAIAFLMFGVGNGDLLQ
ncbi:hypothetical protein K4039_02365 [Lyngbya sp. CCAP 1446/10]|uniref:hypothetical protein n=1 Tax=Lyngbya sp. CCAP 1446/10 TaxID=439293 RepID=UPI002237F8CF|nr:hypothetical protein [Lyngbya sp. CCAP 1446/10]MCW6048949.1 hypothetical protein [Lyngbya sp. CCAP 1446/10]